MGDSKSSGDESKDKNTPNYSQLGARAMTNIQSGEEIVISGIAGCFPGSNDIHEFRDNLFNKVNMVLPNRRWDLKHPEIPTCSGTIPNIDLYDAGFFGVHERQSNSLDPMISLLQEKTIEAIFDAGLHPSDLHNTRTGVYVGICFSENDKTWFFDNLDTKTYAMTGSERSMAARRLSYFLKLKGPSFTSDTACSSSLYAFEHAYRALRLGEIDYAIVGGTNMCLHPFVSLQFARLGVLSPDGSCKAFDEQGNGYARSEAIGVLILQKAKDAKRIYSEVIHVKTNCDGYKEQGITFPSKDAQRQLMTEFYDECNVDRYSLSFLEAHGTGTFVGDPEECSAIDDVFTKERKSPLLIGSVKSNIGHSEPASGVCSIIKCIIGMETGLIPPNIHYNKPRAEIKGLVEGRMKVVTEKMPFEDDRGLIGINSFGFGGGNCHILLRWNSKLKERRLTAKDNLPRLVCVSARTEQGVASLLDSVSINKFDPEYIKLLHDGFRKNVDNHLYRGYTLVSQSGEISKSIKLFNSCRSDNPALYIVFGELDNWQKVGCDLLKLPAFSKYLHDAEKVLLGRKINILEIFVKETNENVGQLLGSVLVQLGIVEILKLVNITPTSNIGSSLGRLPCLYSGGSISLEEAINYAYCINDALNKEVKAIQNNNNNNNYEKNKIFNGDYITKSIHEHDKEGYKTALDYIKSNIKNKDFTTLGDHLLQSALKYLGSTKGGRDKRIVKNVIEGIFNTNLNNVDVKSPNTVILKIGNEHQIARDELENVSKITLNGKSDNSLVEFLKVLGSLYEAGFNPEISKLYPSVEFPVSRGTQMISPYIKWNHRKLKYIPQYNIEVASQATHGARAVKIQIDDHEWRYVKGHVIDGRNLFPAMGYLYLVWETFAIINNLPISVMSVGFENCTFIRATVVPKRGYLTLNVSIQTSTGIFEVVEGDTAVVTGRIYLLTNNQTNQSAEDLRKYNFTCQSNSKTELSKKDVYKELRLRGYNYSGEFRAIERCGDTATEGYVKWEDNWVTFMDNMLQLKIMQSDTRLLYVPTFVSKLTIIAKVHLEMINNEILKGDKTPVLHVRNDVNTDTIRCGGINIWGLIASSIPRKKILGIPVLESYKFVPNFTVLDIYQSIRVNMQIILENSLMYKVKATELIDENDSDDIVPLTPIIKSMLEDQPLIHPFLKILTKKSFPEDIGVEIDDKRLKSENDCLIVIASNVLSRPELFEEATNALTDDGFIITRESHQYDTSKEINSNFTIFTMHRTSNETLILLRRKPNISKRKYIKITAKQNFSWLPEVQNAVVKEKYDDVILYSENEPKNGILGLVNCLRREPQSKHVRCVFIMEEIEEFNPQNSFYANQLTKHMAVNIYKNGQWGTYRHLLLNKLQNVESEHCFVNVTSRGDLSSLKWIEGPLRHNMKDCPERGLIHVYYSSLNFRDVMTALGKINVDVITRNRLAQECVQGFEFSGRDKKGRRIMGMITHGALSTLLLDDSYMRFIIPDEWSFEEAATVPVVYSTVIYALIMRGKLTRGESILIHSGTGGVGQAAIRIALHYGCKVFTTVGNNEKREFLKKTFPQLKDHHIGNSHDESFEQLVYSATKGLGVDMVLNSLAEEKLIASVRCLARGGRFIEIGKFDLANNHQLSTLLFQKEASFHGIMLDQLFSDPPQIKKELMKIMLDGMKYGAIKPLSRSVFKYDEIEQAFRFMATGKHTGKVLIQVRKPEKEVVVPPVPRKFTGIARFFCDEEKVYVIAGGLGGFGLELTDWLVLRGAKKVVLVSRKGVTTGYQSYRINLWKSYGVIVHISNAPLTTKEGCQQLIEESLKLGRIDAIFNLAVVLADGVFENQTQNNFATSFGPKAYATEYLDEITRNLCSDLSQFVVFSSVSCGRGNAGQTNYGMSNSVMERICEGRKQAGYPALAIEWGAIGEVGLVAEMLEEDTEIEISGTLQQRISSCLQVLDTLLRQQDDTIVSSIVVAEKKLINAADNVVDAVINILGLNDSKSVSLHATLAELGMDSMTAVEIKQVLERDFEVFLTAKDIRTMTLAKLKDIQNEKLDDKIDVRGGGYFGIEMMFRMIGDESQNLDPFVEMKTRATQNVDAPKLVLFPGIEGLSNIYNDLSTNLDSHAICVQLDMAECEKTIPEMAEQAIPVIEKFFTTDNFTIVGYSFGSLIALEVVNSLESLGLRGTIILIDGSPRIMKEMLNSLDTGSDAILESSLLCYLLSFYLSHEEISKHQENIIKCANWDDRVSLGIQITKHRTIQGENYQRSIANSIYNRLKALKNYTPSYSNLKSRVTLLKPSVPNISGLPEDYGLSEYFEQPVEIHCFEGNHVTILDNARVTDIINSCLNTSKS